MKKSLFFIFLLTAAVLQAEPFYVRVNGSTDYAATATGAKDYQGRTQYASMGVTLAAGDRITCFDKGNNAEWNIAVLDQYGAYKNFSTGSAALTCNVAGTYNVYIKMKMNDDMWYIEAADNGGGKGGGDNPQEYATAVPAECSDIMLQAFYWDSYKGGQSGDNYGDTKWPTLNSQASEINRYFDLVWLAPSGSASDNNGYLPRRYSVQSSYHGTITTLKQLIESLHNGGTKVLADIVINHCSNKNSWCDFLDLDFGEYGKFQPESTWITKDDEGASKCDVGSNNDDGQENNRNYESARDFDHKSSDVQAMCKAYLKWMLGYMQYDGFRYDYCVGFHVSHVNEYNSAAKPYFSVMEYWNGDANTLKTRIDQAGKNTLIFDFANKYTALRDGIFNNSYTNCKNAGLRGKGYQKYAVTFVDNHDTFHRSNAQDVANKSDGSSINNESLMMQCNAYILALPGVPCVFYPHWVKYKEQIKKMIDARRVAGIHSESTMTEEAGSNYYRATIQGKTGSIKLMLGEAASDAAPAGYTLAVKGTKYAMYYQGTGNTAVENIETAIPALDPEQPMYNILGQRVGSDYQGVVIQNGHKYLR